MRRIARFVGIWEAALFLVVPCSAQAQDRAAQDQSEIREGAPGDVSLAMLLDPEFRFELEQALLKRDLEKAEQLLANQIENNPEAPKYELLVYLGGLFFSDSKYLNAAIAFKKAEAIEPLDKASRFTLSMSYITLGKRDWARPELLRLAQEEPENPLYLYWLARLDYDENNYAEAIRKLEETIRIDPKFIRAYDRMALCYEALGKNPEAIAWYEKAIALNREAEEKWAWPPLNLGNLLIQLGQLERAEQSLREAVSYSPDLAEAHYKLGLALEKLERLEDSTAELRRAAELNPAYPDPHWALGRVLRRTGDREGANEAIKLYQKLKAEAEARSQGSGAPM